MNKADLYMKNDIENILNNGYWDENPRPHYKDGTPAHTISVNHVLRKYDLSKGEFPICSLRPIAWKTGIKEIFAIYQNQSNKISEFERLGCNWWADWSLEDGTIGRAYPYNLESHRPGEMNKVIVKVHRKMVDVSLGEIEDVPYERIVCGVGYLGDYESVKNFTNDEIEVLRLIWNKMIARCHNNPENGNTFVHREWHSFEQFLRDIRMVPQYFLARENGFIDWTLTPVYYDSNCYGKDTCVFLEQCEVDRYKQSTCEDTDEYIYRYELSRNQVIELLRDLKSNPYGRRHIMSFWHWANIDKKSLVECAYETIWNVRNDGKGNECLDMCLIQRSGDMLTASGAGGINEIQYAALLMMISRHCGYNAGVFSHFISNEQIYSRHQDAASEMLRRYNQLREDEVWDGANPTPMLILNPDKTDFFSFTIDDFEIADYNPIKPQLTLELGI